MKDKEKSFFQKYAEYQFFKGLIAVLVFVLIVVYILVENLFSFRTLHVINVRKEDKREL